jgi:hypothetical protein
MRSSDPHKDAKMHKHTPSGRGEGTRNRGRGNFNQLFDESRRRTIAATEQERKKGMDRYRTLTAEIGCIRVHAIKVTRALDDGPFFGSKLW